MRAYLRTDGMYDTYEVEPKVMTAAEYDRYVRTEKLKSEKAELETRLNKVNEELATLESPVVANPQPVVTAATPSSNNRIGVKVWRS